MTHIARLTTLLFVVTLGVGSPRPAQADDAPRQTAETAHLVLKVVHPTEVREGLIATARRLGGFPTLVTNDQLDLKVPPARLGDLLDAVGAAGLVLDRSMDRKDLTARIAQLEARVRSKSEILERVRTFVGDSNVQATLEIERSLTGLVTELEQVKGQLRVERERARHAVVSVSFRFPKRDRLVSVESPFEWLNGVDLDRFLQEF